MINKLCLLLAIAACATSSAELPTQMCVKAIWGGPTAKSHKVEMGTQTINNRGVDITLPIYWPLSCKVVGVEVKACQQDLVELSFPSRSVVHLGPTKNPTWLKFTVDWGPTAKSDKVEMGTQTINNRGVDITLPIYWPLSCKVVGVEVKACQQDLVELSFPSRSVVHLGPTKNPTWLKFTVDCESRINN